MIVNPDLIIESFIEVYNDIYNNEETVQRADIIHELVRPLQEVPKLNGRYAVYAFTLLPIKDTPRPSIITRPA